MVITRTPLRVSFFGGGTDYPAYFKRHGGAVLSTSIDKYVYVTVSRLGCLFDHKLRVAYSKTELVKTADEIQHPSVKACLSHLGIKDGLEISVTTDLPARTGLGSSSSFTVGLLKGLHSLQGRLVENSALAAEAIHVEQNVICERVGNQDQVAAAVGGLNFITFRQDGSFLAELLPVSSARKQSLFDHIFLVYTGISRFAEDVLQEQCANVENRLAELAAIKSLAIQGRKILCDERYPISDFGALLHHAWIEKKKLSSRISTGPIEQIYNTARDAGATGGKLLGAGGGGFLLIFAEPDKHPNLRTALANYEIIDFHPDNSGSSLVYYHTG
jgi:D-glycero-alpha-D-manno-heptose-7-phosphate kinase